jgi:CopG family transcriptional regulator/antitoxin EndoAI
MRTATVNISFRKDLLDQIDSVAKKQARSRSELIREAARAYIERTRSWESLISQGQMLAKKAGIQPADLDKELREYRKARGKKA